MSNNNRFTVSDRTVSAAAREDVIVGKAFAFVSPSALAKMGLSWLQKLLGQQVPVSPHIVSLLGPDSVDLTGVEISPTQLAHFALKSAVSDKSLYRAEKDTVNILVLDPLSPESTQVLQLRNGGNVFSRHSIALGKNGEGQLKLHDLPVGDYDIVFEGQTEPVCEFVVAEYRLVPLVASLQNSQVTVDGALNVTLYLESFGVPLNGAVKLDLLDRNQCIRSLNIQAQDGVVSSSFMLTGSGPHTIAIQSLSDVSKTATVPLRGSREEERTHTVFSPLGMEVVGSLLPIGNAKPVRGIYFAEGALRTSPVSLDRVDCASAQLKVNTAIESLKVLILDPTFPRARATAVDPVTAKHPHQYDDQYRLAERFFNSGHLAKACVIFEERRASSPTPHPLYAYMAACCYAKSEQVEKAVEYLKLAILDGWKDFARLQSDNALSSLRNYEPYEMLRMGGMKELTYSDLSAGEQITLDTVAPVSVLVMGAYVDGKPWEGWTTVVAPSQVTTEIAVNEVYTPGEMISIDIESNKNDASIYAIVKDARLISADTPELKLASATKKYVESLSTALSVQYPTASLDSLTVSLTGKQQMPVASYGSSFGFAGASGWGGAPQTLAESIRTRVSQGQPEVNNLQSRSSGSARSARMSLDLADDSLNALARLSSPPPAGPPPAAAPFPVPGSASIGHFSITDREMDTIFEKMGVVPTAEPQAVPKGNVRSLVITDDPEVLFAGFVSIENGKGKLTVHLPDTFADYIIECFSIAGMDWSSKETKFRAAKDPFVQLSTPVFARAEEPCLGRVHVGSTEKVKLTVLLDGEPIALLDADGKPLKGEISGQAETFTFHVKPGTYEAILERDDEEVARHQKRVDEPGRLKRTVRTLQLLQSGQTISLSDETSMRSISLQPGIDTSFNVLVDATADYSHCCCEQTAAKILAGCAMYMLSGDGDDERRKKAESIIIAGVRREKKMWIKGRGFMPYPDRQGGPDYYVGPRAARYLWNLSFLKDSQYQLTADLTAAIEEALEMADDTTRAYGLSWPVENINSCEEGYYAVRFNDNGTVARALTVADNLANDNGTLASRVDPYLGRAVYARTEAAYAAATLLRSGGAGRMKSALKLANSVIGQFNEQGRLYSTCDSVAAIALMSELKNCGITAGGGKVEVNGKKHDFAETLNSTDEITAIKVLEGIATVAIDRMVEEDWTSYSSNVPLRISLLKDGNHTRKFTAGDTVELVVTLESGYKMGDLLWLALPDALSRVVGGGQVKLFSIDFCGKSEVRIALAATGITDAISNSSNQQSLCICVRNMFEEERVGCPGLIPISVSAK